MLDMVSNYDKPFSAKLRHKELQGLVYEKRHKALEEISRLGSVSGEHRSTPFLIGTQLQTDCSMGQKAGREMEGGQNVLPPNTISQQIGNLLIHVFLRCCLTH